MLIAVADLLAAVEARRTAGGLAGVQQWTPVTDNVERYASMVEEGRLQDDAMLALKGANLLTTVTKSIGDAEQDPADRIASELALQAQRHAVDTARNLRGDAGIAL